MKQASEGNCEAAASTSCGWPDRRRWRTVALWASLVALVAILGGSGCGSDSAVTSSTGSTEDAGRWEITEQQECADHETRCGDECVDLESERDHCGACGSACGDAEVCVQGVCELACADGQQVCSGGCFDLETSTQHCGGCGNACAAGQVCDGGTCSTSCSGALVECDGSCRDVQHDPNHCGGCGNACDAGQICLGGTCVVTCPAGQSECGGGCYDLQASNAHCGACGAACEAGDVCSNGVCETTCPSGQSICDGGCHDLDGSDEHCGSCGNTCRLGTDCVHGQCTVLDGYPSAVPGLTLWLAADRDVSSAGSGEVSAWLDGSGAGNDVIAPTDSSERPILSTDPWGGHAAVYFDGEDDSLALPSGFNDFTDGLTLIVVARPSGERKNARIIDLGRGAADDNILVARDERTDDLVYEVFDDKSSAGTITSSDGLPGRNYTVLSITHRPNGDVEVMNGTTVAATGNLALPRDVQRTKPLIAGTEWTDVDHFEGYIAEILLYDKAISATDRDNIALYLADKYKLYHPSAEWLDDLDSTARTRAEANGFHRYQLDDNIYSSLPPVDACQDHLTNGHSEDGLYRVQPSAASVPILVSCDMTSENGGWIELSLDDSDGVVVSENSASNPWRKCADDSAKHFAWLAGEGSVTPDSSPSGSHTHQVTLEYANPLLGERYSSAEVDALRGVVTELHPDTRMVALTSDDDHYDWHNGDGIGHEVYVSDTSGNWKHLTIGVDGQCGGSSSWPYSGSQSGYYLWHNSASLSVVDGEVNGASSASMTGLAPAELVPVEARMEIHTGGGAAFGWEKNVFKVR